MKSNSSEPAHPRAVTAAGNDGFDTYTGGVGTSSGSVPQSLPTTAERLVHGVYVAEELRQGIHEGAGDLVREVGTLLVLNALTFGGYSSYQLATHGAAAAGSFTVPQDTWLQVPNASFVIEEAAQAAAMNGTFPAGMARVIPPGGTAPNLVLYPPGMTVRPSSWQVTRPTLLRDMLEPNMGFCVWGACRGLLPALFLVPGANALVRAESASACGGGSTTFLHGVPTSAAESIMGALRPDSVATDQYPAGSFFTHEASLPNALEAASHWPVVQLKVTSMGVSVVEMTVPNATLQGLQAQGPVRVGPVPGLPGFPMETVLMPGALDARNASTTFSERGGSCVV